MKQKQKGNTCGIIGLSLGWFIPIAGLVLGIISLCRKEDYNLFGILSIIFSVLFWIFWAVVLVSWA